MSQQLDNGVAQVLSDDRRHVFHSWSAQGQISPVAIANAKGSWMWDYDGNRYLDFSSQLVNVSIGHQHPKMVAAIQEQAAKMCTIAPSFANDKRGEAARLIVERAPKGSQMVFFTNGGAEATENAARMARLFTGKHKILTTYRSYHGATNGSITMTGDPRRWPNEPGMPGVVHFFGPYPYRSPFFSETPEQETERALKYLDELIQLEGPPTIGAIMVETVVGTNGILIPPPGYLQGLRTLCDKYGILLIADEVMCGFGRCGTWFAVDRFGVTPDLITFAKGVNSGYIPLGGVILQERIAEHFRDRVFPGGLTYSGHPLACASACASIRIFEEEGILEHVLHLETDVFGPGLAELATKHPGIGDVRGLGAFWAIELVKDRKTREPLVPYAAAGAAAKPMTELAMACRKRGLWPFTHFNRMHVCPPLTISDDEARQGLAILDEVFAEVLPKYA
ncbi:MAG: aspartate aminotransferase family protein [Myxococcales bacterium]|nr:aspartate aminotransferase family protein [Myxococcales bacterium]